MTLDELEKKYETQRLKIIKISSRYQKYHRVPFLNGYTLTQLMHENIKFNDLFVKLREETKKIHPELIMGAHNDE